jgi:hypothetical protein
MATGDYAALKRAAATLAILITSRITLCSPIKVVREEKMSIARRRELKRQIAALSLQCARIGPVALSGNGILSQDESDDVLVACTVFLTSLRGEDDVALRTAKGCNRPPAHCENVGYLTFIDFLRGVLHGHCAASIVHDLALWGRQVVNLNPNTFNAVERAAYMGELDNIVQAQLGRNERYARNPGLVGPPMNQIQAMDWLFYHSAYALLEHGLANANVAPGTNIVLPQGQQTVDYNTYMDNVFAELAPEFRNNPNCKAFMSDRSRAATRAWKCYGKLMGA